jgi:hypothetical protein
MQPARTLFGVLRLWAGGRTCVGGLTGAIFLRGGGGTAQKDGTDKDGEQNAACALRALAAGSWRHLH